MCKLIPVGWCTPFHIRNIPTLGDLTKARREPRLPPPSSPPSVSSFSSPTSTLTKPLFQARCQSAHRPGDAASGLPHKDSGLGAAAERLGSLRTQHPGRLLTLKGHISSQSFHTIFFLREQSRLMFNAQP